MVSVYWLSLLGLKKSDVFTFMGKYRKFSHFDYSALLLTNSVNFVQLQCIFYQLFGISCLFVNNQYQTAFSSISINFTKV